MWCFEGGSLRAGTQQSTTDGNIIWHQKTSQKHRVTLLITLLFTNTRQESQRPVLAVTLPRTWYHKPSSVV